MKRLGMGLLLVVGFLGCQREPAIVVRFEPADLAGRRDLGKPVDAAAPRDLAPAAMASACRVEADCVLVPDGCCDCASGGKQHAVAKLDAPKLTAAQHAACKDQMCTAMVSTDPSCGQRAACVDARCALRAAKAKAGEVKKSKVPAP